MGVNGVLPKILPSAGRENYDLRALSDGIISHAPSYYDEPPTKKRKWTRRKVRIAVDVNGWIARAAHGYGGSLMDERHLSYHGRAELRNEQRMAQQQQQQQQQQQEGKRPEDEDEEPANNINNNTTNNDEQMKIQQQQKMEYITKCTSFVLQRIEFLRNECCALVLPVLDGATPPCKLEVVRERSNRRKRATEQRDEVAQSPQRPLGMRAEEDANADALLQHQEGEEDEAARTEAEVLRRISASKRAGTGKDYSMRRAMLSELLKEFRKRNWPFVVSPYEADGQLAYLANTGAVDLVVTEDSDLIALGVPRLIYKMGGWNGSNDANRAAGGPGGGSGANYFGNISNAPGMTLRGTMLQRCDLGSSHDIDLRDFSDAMLATMFVAAGCDYCDSLKGIGIITARNIVKKAFHESGDRNSTGYSRSTEVPVLRIILNDLFRSCHKDAYAQVMPFDDPEKEMVRLAYERSFLAALAMFRHPLVYDPILGANTISNDVSISDSSAVSSAFLRDEKILMEFDQYRDLVTNKDRLYQVVGRPFAPEIAKGVSEGLIDPRQLLEDETALPQEEGDNQNEDEEQGGSNSGLQLASQDFSGAAGTQQSTQQSKSSSGTSGMISSLSPDLLASP